MRVEMPWREVGLSRLELVEKRLQVVEKNLKIMEYRLHMVEKRFGLEFNICTLFF